MNAPERPDTYFVPLDLPKILVTKDEKVLHAAALKMHREDHTLGNLLRMDLLRDTRVKFAGYKHPHPLENDIVVRVQTNGDLTPVDAVRESAMRLREEFASMQRQFADAVKEKMEEAGHL